MKLVARLAALYATVQMPVDVLMSVWLPEASYVGTKGASPLSSMPVYWLESVGRVGEFLGRFLRRLAVADVVVAVTVGGTAILVIIAYVAGGQHDFSRRSNFIIYKFFLMQINLRYCLIFFGIMQNSLVARFSEYFKY